MKYLLILIAILILAMPVMAEPVVGGALGALISDIDNPGAMIMIGMQSNITQNNIIRFSLNKLNFGDSGKVFDNVSGTDINYFPISTKWPNSFIGLRLSVDYETQDADLGMAIGGEWLQKKKLLFIIPADFVSTYGSLDFVNRQDEKGGYLNIGLGIILTE